MFKSSASGLSFVMVEPKADKPGSSGALPWIKGWISGMERDLKALKGPSDSLQSALKEHCLALDAFVDYFLLVELTKNPDGAKLRPFNVLECLLT